MNSGQNDHIVSSFDADLSKLDNMIAEMLVAAAHMRQQLLQDVAAHGSTLIRGERSIAAWVCSLTRLGD